MFFCHIRPLDFFFAWGLFSIDSDILFSGVLFAISGVVILGFLGGFGFVWTVPMDSWCATFFGSSVVGIFGAPCFRSGLAVDIRNLDFRRFVGYHHRVYLDVSSDSAFEKSCGHSMNILSVCRLFGVCLQYLAVSLLFFCVVVCFLFCLRGSVLGRVRSPCGFFFFPLVSLLGGSAGAGVSFSCSASLLGGLRSRFVDETGSCCSIVLSLPPPSSPSLRSPPLPPRRSRPPGPSPPSRCLSVCHSIFSSFSFLSATADGACP